MRSAIINLDRFRKQFVWKQGKNGYMIGRFFGKMASEHKSVLETLLGVTIEKPLEINHIDRNRTNNKIENLEVVFHFENCEEQDRFNKGINFQKDIKKWRPSFKGKKLGSFNTKQEAINARQKAIDKYLDENKSLCEKKLLLNLKIQDYIRTKNAKPKEYSLNSLGLSKEQIILN